MSSWMHIQGSVGIDGAVWDEDSQKQIHREISKLFNPPPWGSEIPARITVRQNERHCTHCADVMLVGDLRDVGSQDVFVEWLEGFKKKMEYHPDNPNPQRFTIRSAVFLVEIENINAFIYSYSDFAYVDGEGLNWDGNPGWVITELTPRNV
jgi:hypothetical protein